MIDLQTNPVDTQTNKPVQVWDFPTRAFHWLLVLLIGWEWATSHLGGNWMTYHMWGGYVVLGLILFRVLWGFVGSTTARFSSFLCSPRRTWQYVKTLVTGSHNHSYGHNPLGGWSVAAFLVSLSIQVGTGLFSTDDILTAGPLNPLVRNRTADFLTLIHKVNFDVLLGLVAIHIVAVVLHRVIGGHNLVGPMITGRAPLKKSGAHPGLAFARGWTSILALTVSAVIAWLIIRI
ncbi:MAG: cytochrome b/b6 domain-containing protein [Acidiferrobacter sp.]